MDAAFAVADVGLRDLALVAAVALVMSVIGGLSGYGIGLVLPAFLAPVVGVVATIPVMSVAMIFANASRVWVYRRALSGRHVALLLAVSLPMALIGSVVYTHLSAGIIATVLGAFMIASVPLRRRLERGGFTLGRRGLAGIGAAYGLMAGGMSGTGLFL
ncbi:MAG: sulfite exporter TauE/SafE family protein, partial [Alphaproteobacteria bacterium]|nr:sulfite exporter TauE/SafE family protein [Alphaproteobacteria bacterium]